MARNHGTPKSCDRRMTTVITLSCRDPLGDLIEDLGPFLNVIFRPGSNWIEVQSPDQNWDTISGSAYARVLVKVHDAADTPIAPAVDYSGGW